MSRFSLNFANYESLGFSDITQSLYFRTHRTINQRPEYYSTLNPTKINEHSTLRYSPDRAKMVTVIGSSTKSSTKYFRRNEREREEAPSLIPPFRSEKREQRILVRRRRVWPGSSRPLIRSFSPRGCGSRHLLQNSCRSGRQDFPGHSPLGSERTGALHRKPGIIRARARV